MRPGIGRVVAAVGMLVGVGVADAADVRLANWNVANLPNDGAQADDFSTVIEYIGTLNPVGEGARPIDLLALAETDTGSAEESVALFNTLYGSSTYAGATASTDPGGDRTGFIYNQNTLTLLGTRELSAGMTHTLLAGNFVLAADPSVEFTAYSIHLASGDTPAARDQRLVEAELLRADADGLGSSNLIYAGDFNWTGVDERGSDPILSAWDALTAPGGSGQGLDPVAAPGDWRDNPAFLDLHTQDPSAAMDDRFDMQLLTAELFDDLGLDYLDGSYTVVGNNGTHTLDMPITTGTGAPSEVLSSLTTFDHLPVFTDFVLIPEPGTLVCLVGVGGALLLRRR